LEWDGAEAVERVEALLEELYGFATGIRADLPTGVAWGDGI
jgi:hypothetical protein